MFDKPTLSRNDEALSFLHQNSYAIFKSVQFLKICRKNPMGQKNDFHLESEVVFLLFRYSQNLPLAIPGELHNSV